MCELLALSSSRLARLTFSLHTLASHGGAGASTRDGWGVAFYQGSDVALFRAPEAAGDSPLVRHLESQGPSTNLAISHIRHATRGSVNLANTQPFVRELGGHTHVFAHNGDLPGIWNSAALALGAHRPVGETDSEHAFCSLLARLRPLWEQANPPTLEERLAVLAAFATELRAVGPANFLYADGDALFAHGHRRWQRSSGRAEPPGLWMRQRHCPPGDLASDHLEGVAIADAGQSVLWIASVPLTDDAWRPLSEGELLAVRDGQVVSVRMPATR